MKRTFKQRLFLLLVGLVILGLTGCASDREARKKTEMEALVAYLQGMGNHIKFEEGVNYRD